MAQSVTLSIAARLYQFRYDDEKVSVKPNGKPILKCSEHINGFFDKGYEPDNAININRKFVCTICLNIPRHPIELKNCGHVYCRGCISQVKMTNNDEWSTAQKICPLCRTVFTEQHIINFDKGSKTLQKIFNEIVISCSFTCGRHLSIYVLNDHEMWLCPRRPVQCPNNGCGIVLPDQEMEEHLDICPKRYVYCSNCFLPRKHDQQHDCVKTLRAIIFGIIIPS